MRLLYVGGLAPNKGVHVVLQALHAVHGAVQLEIIGDDTAHPGYIAQLHALAGANVEFRGAQEHRAVWSSLKNADVLVVPSLWHETYCFTAREGIAAGVPVIASAMGALTELIDSGRNGLLLAPGDVAAWRAAIQRLIDDRQQIDQWRRAQQPVETFDAHVDQIQALYRGIVGHTGEFDTMISLLAGMSLGFGAGISPGPLMTLVVTRTLSNGFGAGLRVAIAPFLTDAPIILLTLLLFNALPPLLEVLLTVGGGLFVIYLGMETMHTAGSAHLDFVSSTPQSATVDIWRGIFVNVLSPHPWLFWISVGSPTLTAAWRVSPWNALAFLVGFYSLLVGGKIALAFAVAGGRRYLTDAWYQRLLIASGLLLCVFGGLLLWRAVGSLMA